jgi:hypothetical protein
MPYRPESNRITRRIGSTRTGKESRGPDECHVARHACRCAPYDALCVPPLCIGARSRVSERRVHLGLARGHGPPFCEVGDGAVRGVLGHGWPMLREEAARLHARVCVRLRARYRWAFQFACFERVCARACVRACECVRACVRACVRSSRALSACVRLRACVRACVRDLIKLRLTWLRACAVIQSLHAYQSVYINAYLCFPGFYWVPCDANECG